MSQPTPPTPQQLDTASLLCSKLHKLNELVFELRQIRLQYQVHDLSSVTDWADAGTVSHLSQSVVAAYGPAIDRLDAALVGTEIVPAMEAGSPPPIVLFTKLARG